MNRVQRGWLHLFIGCAGAVGIVILMAQVCAYLGGDAPNLYLLVLDAVCVARGEAPMSSQTILDSPLNLFLVPLYWLLGLVIWVSLIPLTAAVTSTLRRALYVGVVRAVREALGES